MNGSDSESTTNRQRGPASSLIVRGLLGLVAAFLVAALLALLGGALYVLPRWSSDQAAGKEVARLVAELHATGQPMTAADLYRFHSPSPGTPDSTPAWLAAQKLCTGKALLDGAELPYIGSGKPEQLKIDPSQLGAAEAFLEKHATALEAILYAARHPGECRYPVKFEQTPLFTVDETQEVRSIVRLLALHAHVKAVRGESQPAVQSLLAMFAASDSASHQVTVVEQLVRLVTLSVAMQQAEVLMNELPLSNEQLIEIGQRVEATDIQGSFTRALIGERAVANEGFNHMTRAALLAEEHQQVLQATTDAIELSADQLPAARDKLQQIIASLKARPRRWSGRTAALAPPYLSSLQAAFNTYVRTIAYREALLTAIAAERHRLKAGRFPSRFDEIDAEFLPSPPVDPFTGGPFEFRSSDDEITISSFGANGKDDSSASASGGWNDDIVVRVRAIKAAPSKTDE
jgi:hypothetical protein